MQDVRVFVGGIIPVQDIPSCKGMGVEEVFLPGASTQDVVRLIDASRRRSLDVSPGRATRDKSLT